MSWFQTLTANPSDEEAVRGIPGIGLLDPIIKLIRYGIKTVRKIRSWKQQHDWPVIAGLSWQITAIVLTTTAGSVLFFNVPSFQAFFVGLITPFKLPPGVTDVLAFTTAFLGSGAVGNAVSGYIRKGVNAGVWRHPIYFLTSGQIEHLTSELMLERLLEMKRNVTDPTAVARLDDFVAKVRAKNHLSRTDFADDQEFEQYRQIRTIIREEVIELRDACVASMGKTGVEKVKWEAAFEQIKAAQPGLAQRLLAQEEAKQKDAGKEAEKEGRTLDSLLQIIHGGVAPVRVVAPGELGYPGAALETMRQTLLRARTPVPAHGAREVSDFADPANVHIRESSASVGLAPPSVALQEAAFVTGLMPPQHSAIDVDHPAQYSAPPSPSSGTPLAAAPGRPRMPHIFAPVDPNHALRVSVVSGTGSRMNPSSSLLAARRSAQHCHDARAILDTRGGLVPIFTAEVEQQLDTIAEQLANLDAIPPAEGDAVLMPGGCRVRIAAISQITTLGGYIEELQRLHAELIARAYSQAPADPSATDLSLGAPPVGPPLTPRFSDQDLGLLAEQAVKRKYAARKAAYPM